MITKMLQPLVALNTHNCGDYAVAPSGLVDILYCLSKGKPDDKVA